MYHASLFSGIGGFDIAAEWVGWTNVFNCEINPFCRKTLKRHFPNAEQYEDIKATDFTSWRGRVDVLTGGFPCQPFSTAGKRKGTADDRYLWPEMLRAVREIRPRWIVGENVLGIVSWDGGMVFEQVHADLEAEGYEVQAFILPACGVNAPHRRDRTWFIAHAIENTECDGCEVGESKEERAEVWQFGNACTGSVDGVHIQEGATPHTDSEWGYMSPREGREAKSHGGANDGQSELWREPSEWDSRLHDVSRDDTDAASTRWGGSARLFIQGRECRFTANRQEHLIFDRWLAFPTQSPVRSRDDGFPVPMDGIIVSKWRAESIKAYGNAIVPQVAYRIFVAIKEYDHLFSGRVRACRKG